MTTISAKSILASRHALNSTKRVDTLLLRYPRWIHAEFMTHRVFSRNASSSRAIPVKKLIQDVVDDPAEPLYWGKNQKGMQAGEELSGEPLEEAKSMWRSAMAAAIHYAVHLDEIGAHKQIVNRLLEPFSHITVVATASQWSNFLALRDHKDAEPHIQMLARAIREAIDGAEVKTLEPGEWHLPFITDEEWRMLPSVNNQISAQNLTTLQILSVARCASTSYKTVEGFEMTIERARAIFEKLYAMTPIHASPYEHQVKADDAKIFNLSSGVVIDEWRHPFMGGNLGPGWVQFRKMLPGECL
jgi:thymidylate synthase ThyX